VGLSGLLASFEPRTWGLAGLGAVVEIALLGWSRLLEHAAKDLSKP
jgi:hypothetical protein